ncbi:MAG: ribonuclease H-like domain-containing protein [Candidatus Omnitrophica bacterium]|nr:ribonuclease H-like domain-containing protein [Candidatus Omnitrophota bacterium]
MNKVIFDIETIGAEFDEFDQTTQEVLLKSANNDEEEQAVKEGLGLSPLTGEIVAIGMLDCDFESGTVFFQDLENSQKNHKEEDIEYIVCSEKEILENFWKTIKRYNQFITFNGRGFDCPYILIRSAILKIKAARDLMPYRYDTKAHIDLYDQMTFYGAMRRGFSLHMFAQAFGIKSPKEEGISGAQVKDLFSQKKYIDIARYCMRDVKATKELYFYWEKYIKC